MQESASRRAWTDTNSFRTNSQLWFWGVEVIGAVCFAVTGIWLTPANASHFTQSIYPVIGVFIGIVATFFVILVWNLFRAPYCQRDELRLYLHSEEIIDISYGQGITLCRDIQSNEEKYRVLIGVRVNKAIDNLEVYPIGFWKGTSKDISSKIKRTRLTPMAMVDRPVNPGRGTYYVDIFKHKIGSSDIIFCYRDIPNESITLGKGQYLLQLAARGKENEYGYCGLVIKIDNKNTLKVSKALPTKRRK